MPRLPHSIAVLALLSALGAQDLALVPWPTRVEQLGGVVRVDDDAWADPAPGSVPIDPGLGAGAYRITIDGRVEVVAGDAQGAAWAAATLFQLRTRDEHSTALPRVRIEDAPALGYRGVMLDVARFWHPIETLRAAVDLLWLSKIRYLHLHLSDDQSFTFPTATLPKLPSMFADGTRRHYTRDELAGLIAYAESRGVTVVPEIDVPGHASLMGRAYPELFGTVDANTGQARSTGVINMANERAYAALDALFAEVCEVFAHSPYVHLGADEVAAGGLVRLPEYRTYCEANDLPRAVRDGDVHELYCHFVGRVCAMIRARGKRPMAWEGFAGGGTEHAPIPRDLVVMAWNLDMNPPDRLIDAGFEVVNCGWWPLYIVPPQGRAPTARDAYAWHPRRFETWARPEPFAVLPPAAPLFGAQLCMWEQTPEVVVPLLRSRLPAIAERLWAPDRPRTFEDLSRRAAAVDAKIAPRFVAHQPAVDLREPFYRYRFFPAPPRRAWDAMPDLESLTPTRTGELGRASAERVRAINAAMFVGVEPFGHVETRIPDGWNPYAIELEGRLRIPAAGVHEFRLRSTDGLAELWIADERVAWRQRPGSPQHDVTRGHLAAGVHRFAIRYFYRSLHNELNLRVVMPGADRPVEFESLLLPLGAADSELAPRLTSLATGRPVQSSGGTEGAMMPLLAVDGDPSNESGWHAHPYPQHLTVDLGAVHPVDRVRVVTYHDGRRHYRYTVDASADGQQWATIVDRSANTTPASAAGIEDRCAPTSSRFVRVNLLFNSANPGVHLSELLVFADGAAPASIPGAPGDEPLDVVVTGEPARLDLPDRALIRSLVFAPEIAIAATVAAPRLRLADGARIAYPRNAATVNQTIAADLELLGDATFANDNPWTHDAHVLRIDGALRGSGTLIVDGEADGGVDLRRDSAATFSGAVRIDGGMLIARRPTSLGPATTPLTMRGGKLFLPGTGLPQALTVERSGVLWIGGPVEVRGDVAIAAGATLTVDTGGGNATALLGALTGDGDLRVRAGPRGTASPALTLGGDGANTLRGTIRVEFGALALAKPDGVLAVPAGLALGGTAAPAGLRLDGDEQIADDARVALDGPGPVILELGGHRETLGALAVGADAVLRCGPGPDRIHFADSAGEIWTGTLIVEGWRHDQDRVMFGVDRRALTAEQLARVGFRNLDGQAPGLLRAVLRDDGTLSPGERVWPRDDVPFRVDGVTDRKRRALYESDGLRALGDATTTLRAGDTLSFFGDSITWLGGFAGRIAAALAAGDGTRELGVRVRNRGINGGGVRDLRDGSTGAARAGGSTGADGNAPQASFDAVLREDATTVAVVLIGINDVNWKGTSDAEFETALRALCDAAAAAGARTVLATLLLDGERPDGSNPKDAHIERIAAITRRVAREERAVLVDLRTAAIAWLQNHNRQLELDGTLTFERVGLLTYDGIHLSDQGDELVANLLADGIVTALQDR